MDSNDVQADLKHVLYTKEQIQQRITELAAQIDKDYEGRDLLIVGVLKGAVMVMADLARALHSHVSMDWMAVSSYGSGTQSSGVVRILKDLDTDLMGKDVLIVEDIIDSGLTLSWLKTNLESRGTASVEICTASASRRPPRSRSTSSTSAMTSPTSSSWATAWTTPRSTATWTSSAPWRRTSTSRSFTRWQPRPGPGRRRRRPRYAHRELLPFAVRELVRRCIARS